MTAKQFLNKARAIDLQIDSLEETKHELRDQLLNTTQNYDSDSIQGQKDPHKFDALVIVEDQINELINQLLIAKKEALGVIFQLQDWRLREVLKRRYVDMKSFEQIAASLNYSWRNIMKLHKRGLMEVDKVINGH